MALQLRYETRRNPLEFLASFLARNVRFDGHALVASRTLLVSSERLENAKQLVTKYKRGEIKHMNADLWHAKKIVDSTLHPGTWYLW